jgi:hypothetical protein
VGEGPHAVTLTTTPAGSQITLQAIEVLVAELGQLGLEGLGLLGAPRERARLRYRGKVSTGLRCPGFGRHGSLRSDGVFAALGKNLFDLGVRAGNDVY